MRAVLGVLSLLAFGAATAKAQAQTDAQIGAQAGAGAETEGFSAEEAITVTGSRTGGRITRLPSSISVLSAEDLTEQFALSNDILRALDFTIPGLNLSDGSRSQCASTIRGRTPSFQLNNVPANQDLRPSNCNSAFQVHPFAIEGVEVVRGATALFGAGAPGGIINLRTRRARSQALQFDAIAQTGFNTNRPAGSFQTDVYAGVGQVLGDVDFYLGAGFQDFGVGRDPNGERVIGTDFQSVGVNGSLGYAVAPGLRLRLEGTWYGEDPGREFDLDGAEVDAGVAFPAVIAVPPNPFRAAENDRQYTFALSLEADDVLGHKLFFTGYRQAQEFRQRANFQGFNGGEDDFFNDDRRNSTSGVRLTLVRELNLGEAELRFEYGADYQRNRLVRIIRDPEDGATPVNVLAPETILSTFALFGQGEVRLSRVRLSGGLRQEFYRGRVGPAFADLGLPGTGTPGDFSNESLLLANAGIVVDLTQRLQAFASYTQGAEITQLGRAGRNADDPGLISPEPAISDQFELGARGSVGPVKLTFAGFYSESDAASLVQPDPTCAGESFCPLIPLRTPQETWGVEATLEWKPIDRLELGGVFTWQRGRIFNEDLGGFVPFGSDTVSPTRLSSYVEWQPVAPLNLRFQSQYITATNFFTPFQRSFGFVETTGVFLADAAIDYSVGPVRLSLAVSNLFNREFVNVTSAGGGFASSLTEGRRLTLGLRGRF